MINTILFDMDGTLIDTRKVTVTSLQFVLKKYQKQKFSTKELEFVLGIPGKEAIQHFGFTTKENQFLLAKWDQMIAANFAQVHTFFGITGLLNKLYKKSIKLGIVTSETKKELALSFRTVKIEQYFMQVITVEDTIAHKPNPEPILKAMDLLCSPPQETLFVGDTIYDYECARRSAVAFMAALWGQQDNSFSFPSKVETANTPNEVLQIFA
ncbi:HAD family hydrolase [Lactobacillus sp. ESL0791]|uniref:HAD family hydrolase n=1 Tax=Lactobacillus sp. ESL0791 TaxID=2983234 RepID=UPI0023FA0220|nr:HAD family hydrolase [Lactobacillus sp. ESL0791]MDF7639630.1 HAD family hydrolase [Lactobacillus sp. ESL0791]